MATTRYRYHDRLNFLFVLIFSLLASTIGMRAQDLTTTASLGGTITDSSGAIIPGATVVVSGAVNGIVRTVKTDASGSFNVQLLPPSIYILKVDFQGFKTYEQKGITLLPEQAARQNVQLAIGSETQQVVVTSEAPLLNTANANLSAEIGSQQVENLPLDLRNVIALATLNSSVQNSTESQTLNEGGTSGKADQDVSFLNFGGGFFGTTAYVLDGVWDTDSTWGAVIYVPSVEAVQDFKVQTNSFTAQTGFSTGNVVHVDTKSGTRDFHGDAFEYYRGSAFDANTYFNDLNNQPKLSFSRNQYGASAGGPLYIPGIYRQRDKTFVFGVYEGLRQSSPVDGTFSVPTTLMHEGNFSELYTPPAGYTGPTNLGTDALGNPVVYGQLYDPTSGRVLTTGTLDPKTGKPVICPNNAQTCNYRDPLQGNILPSGLISTVGAKLMTYYPKPTAAGYSNNYFASASAPASSDEILVRVDHNLTDLTRLYFRYANKHEQKTNSPQYYDSGYGGNDPGGPGNVRPNNRYSIATGFTHIFNANTALSANAGFERWDQGGLYQGYPLDMTTLGLPASLNASSNEFPIINTASGSSLGPVQGGYGAGIANVGSVAADLTQTLGKNNLSFGFMGVVLQNNGTGPANTTFGFGTDYTSEPTDTAGNYQNFTGNGFATLLTGFPDGGSTANSFHAAPEDQYWGFYAEDDYKATRTLTLNLGLRWEFQKPWTERHNRQAYFDYTAINPISQAVGIALPGEEAFSTSNHRGLYNTNFTNFAPRIGFTEQFSPRWVLRGGYGIFFPPQAFVGIQSSPGYSQSTPVVGSTTAGLSMGVNLDNPFPTGLIAPQGDALGALQDVGYSSSTGVPINRHSPYVQNYSLGLQYAFTVNDVITASYVGNRGTHMLGDSLSHSQVNPALVVPGNNLSSQVANPFYGAIKPGQSGCGLDQPTIQLGHLLSPYPQYCGVSESEAPIGDSFYNALLVDFNHRFNNGMSLLVSYTFSKFIDDVGGTADWAYVGDSSWGFRNNYDPKLDKSVDGSDITHSLVVNYVYSLPIGRGRRFAHNINRFEDAVIGGWQIAGVTSIKSGIPMSIHGGNTTPWYAGQHPNRVGDPYLAHRTIKEWFNTTAFQPSAPYTYGNISRYLSKLRAPAYQDWDVSAQKYWTLTNRLQLQGKAEFFNIANHANFFAPDGGVTDGNFGQISAAFDPRDIQFAARVIW